MKKILLSLGSVAAIVAPIATVVACSSSTSSAINLNIVSSKTAMELKEVKVEDINTIEDAETKLGVDIADNDKAIFKSIKWESEKLTLTIVSTIVASNTESTVIYTLGPKPPIVETSTAKLIAELNSSDTRFDNVQNNMPVDKPIMVGDSDSNHPVRFILSIAQSKLLFGNDFATKDDKLKTLQDAVNALAKTNDDLKAKLNHEQDDHTGENAFDISIKQGLSQDFGIDYGEDKHVEFILNYIDALPNDDNAKDAAFNLLKIALEDSGSTDAIDALVI